MNTISYKCMYYFLCFMFTHASLHTCRLLYVFIIAQYITLILICTTMPTVATMQNTINNNCNSQQRLNYNNKVDDHI